MGAIWETTELLGLALTDRFPSHEVGLFEQAVVAFERLTDEYERTYHLGVAWERSAKAHLERSEAHSAVTAFEHALELFEKDRGLTVTGEVKLSLYKGNIAIASRTFSSRALNWTTSAQL